MTDKPSDDRFADPSHEDDDSASTASASSRPLPLPPPGLFARLESPVDADAADDADNADDDDDERALPPIVLPSFRLDDPTADADEDDVADEDEDVIVLDDDPVVDDAADDDLVRPAPPTYRFDSLEFDDDSAGDLDAPADRADDLEEADENDEEDLPHATLAGVADAVELVEQLAAQAAEAEPDAPSGDDLVFADAVQGINEGSESSVVAGDVDFDATSDDADEEQADDRDAVDEDRVAYRLPGYLGGSGTRDDDESDDTATAALPMYGSERAEGEEEILPHFLLDESAPLDVIAAQDELREMAKSSRRRRERAEEHKPSLARTLAEIPVLLIVAAVIAFLVKTFLAQAYYIPSSSMVPQLDVDDRVVVSKLAYKLHDPRRGDIVVFDDPRNGESTDDGTERSGISELLRKVGEGVGVVQPSTDEFIKRVIGLPGETVSGRDGYVYVNNRKLIEPYLPEGLETSDFPEQMVAEGKLWVMGDNRSGSADSRSFGQIEVDSIVGRAVVKVWPFSSISFL